MGGDRNREAKKKANNVFRLVFSDVTDHRIVPFIVPTGHKVTIDCGGRGIFPYVPYREDFNSIIVAQGAVFELINCCIFLFESIEEGTQRVSQVQHADFGNNPDSIVIVKDSNLFMRPMFKSLYSTQVLDELFVHLPTWPLQVEPMVELHDSWAVTVVQGYYYPGHNIAYAINATNYTIWSDTCWSTHPQIVSTSWQIASPSISAISSAGSVASSPYPATQSTSGDGNGNRLRLVIGSIAAISAAALLIVVALGVVLCVRYRRAATTNATDATKADVYCNPPECKSVCFSFAHPTARSLSVGSTPTLHPYLAQQISGTNHDWGGDGVAERRRSIVVSSNELWGGGVPTPPTTLQEALDEGHLKSPVLRRKWESVLGVLQDVAADLHLMHNAGQVHGHLLPANISLHVHSNATSLAAAFERGDVTSSVSHISFYKEATNSDAERCYRAPEVAAGVPLTPDTDMYSFGVLMWSLVDNQGTSSACLSKVALARSALCSNFRPHSGSSGGNWEPQDKFLLLPEAVPMTYMLAGTACVSRHGKDRPTIKDLLVLLNAVEQEVESGEYVDSQGRVRISTDVRLIFPPVYSAALDKPSVDSASSPSGSKSVAAGTERSWKSLASVPWSELPTE